MVKSFFKVAVPFNEITEAKEKREEEVGLQRTQLKYSRQNPTPPSCSATSSPGEAFLLIETFHIVTVNIDSSTNIGYIIRFHVIFYLSYLLITNSFGPNSIPFLTTFILATNTAIFHELGRRHVTKLEGRIGRFVEWYSNLSQSSLDHNTIFYI